MNRKPIQSRTKKLVGAALFVALVIVMQLISANVRFGPFTITLTLIPIVVGGILYGVGTGALLGAVFGCVVFLYCILGMDAGGAILFQLNPFFTFVATVVRGAIAGTVPALLYHLLKKHERLAAIAAALSAPVVNTGVFLLGMRFLFFETLGEWAAASGMNLVAYVFLGLCGWNFVVEFTVNAVLSPSVITVVKRVKARHE